jgi:hypothetical protein
MLIALQNLQTGQMMSDANLKKWACLVAATDKSRRIQGIFLILFVIHTLGVSPGNKSHHIPMINHELPQNPHGSGAHPKFTPSRITDSQLWAHASDKQGYSMSPNVAEC